MITIKRNKHKIAACGLAALVFLIMATSANAASTTITSLPYTANQTGTNYSETLYVAGTRLTSATNGIDIRGHDIVIYLGVDTVAFGAGNGDGNWGLRFYGCGYNDGSSLTAYNIKVIGGTILHGATSGSVSGNFCVDFGGGSHIYFENTNLIVKGTNGHCLDRPSSGWGIWNVEINGGRWTSDVTGYTSRCQYDGAVARLSSALQPVSGTDYHFNIHNIVMTRSPGQGIIIQGKSYIYACSLTVDARNDFYTYPSNEVCHSSANSFAIITQMLEPGSSIHDNVIRAGEANLGCDGGILLQLSEGSAVQPVEIYNNDIVLHRGHDQYYLDLNAKAFKSRYANKHVNIHNNIFKVQIGDTAYQAYGINGAAVDVVSFWDTGCDWPQGRYPDSFLVYENNYIEVEGLDGTFDEGCCARFAITNNDGYTWTGAGNVWRNNHLKTVMHGYQIGGYDNLGQCQDMFMQGDTIEYASSSWGRDQYAFNVGYDLSSLGNKACDDVFTGGAEETDIHFTNGSGERTLALQRTLRILVLGNNDCPVAGSDVSVRNNYNRTVLTTTTNQSGLATGIVTYLFEAEDGPDSTNFNDFTITVSKSGETQNSTLTVNSSSAADTLRFDNVSGDCDIDTTPPAAIDDLGASPGDHDGEIIISWSAPGDDGNDGFADHYEIRCAAEPLNIGNWEEADICPDPPSPASPGRNQSYTISSLAEGEVYYVAMRTYDDVGWESELSNVPDTFAAGIAVPIQIATDVDSANGSVVVTAEIVESYLSPYYLFELDSLDTYPDPELHLDLSADSVATAAFDSLSNNRDYFWRVCAVAFDGSDTSAWSASIPFNILTGVTGTLTSGDCVYPPPDANIHALRPMFEVNNLPTVGTYYFQVSDIDSFEEPTESGPISKSSGTTTVWQCSDPLEGGTAYYWRVSSNGVIWTSPLAFTTILDIHPYPNPFKPSLGHTSITFTNLTAESDITISTISGQIVLHQDSIGPSDWIWDVKSGGGDDLAPGVYLYSIDFPGGSTSGKVMIIR